MYLKVVLDGHARALIMIAFGYHLNEASVSDRRHWAANGDNGLILWVYTVNIVDIAVDAIYHAEAIDGRVDAYSTSIMRHRAHLNGRLHASGLLEVIASFARTTTRIATHVFYSFKYIWLTLLIFAE